MYYGLDCGFDFFNLSVKFPDELNGMLQFQGFGRHPGTNGASGGIADLHCHIPLIAAFGGVRQEGLQPGQMPGSNLFGSWKLRQHRIDRRRCQEET